MPGEALSGLNPGIIGWNFSVEQCSLEFMCLAWREECSEGGIWGIFDDGVNIDPPSILEVYIEIDHCRITINDR